MESLSQGSQSNRMPVTIMNLQLLPIELCNTWSVCLWVIGALLVGLLLAHSDLIFIICGITKCECREIKACPSIVLLSLVNSKTQSIYPLTLEGADKCTIIWRRTLQAWHLKERRRHSHLHWVWMKPLSLSNACSFSLLSLPWGIEKRIARWFSAILS